MADHMISHLLRGDVAPGTTVTIKGWVRTRRDSKAGLSFIQVHDGTCFKAAAWKTMSTPFITRCTLEASRTSPRWNFKRGSA